MFRFRLSAASLLLALAVLVPTGCGNKDDATPATNEPVEVFPTSFEELDFTAMPDDFIEAVKVIRASQNWDSRSKVVKGDKKADPRTTMDLKMNRELLEESFVLGSEFLANWQKPEGNFRYMYDWVDGTWVEDDHQVRQAGSLWGLGTCYRYKQTDKTREALDKGLKFWFEHTIPGPGDNTLTMKYPGENTIHSGSVALVVLAIVEYLKTEGPMDPAYKVELETKLDGYLGFLLWMQLDNGHISDRFDHRSGRKRQRSSPYYDGETLLALTKAARQLDKKELVPAIEKGARAMAETYTIESWAKDRDSKQTKGFYQWSSMAYSEYYQAGWKDKELFGDIAIALGYWMIHTHATLSRRRNHAYAVEGLIAAWTIANLRKDRVAETDLLYGLDRSLYKLSQWQIGGPLAGKNKWLAKNAKDDPMAIGGVMNAKKPSGQDVNKDVSHQLRIDVTQHQMHAVTTALEGVYVDVK